MRCACVSHSSGCVRLCVCWCPLWCPFLCEGRCAEFPHSHWAFPARLPPTERLRQPPRPHTTDSPLPNPLRTKRPNLEPLAFLLLRNKAEAKDLASRVNCFSLSLCQPGHFVPTRLQRHHASQSRVSCLCAPHLVSLRLDSPQEVSLRDSPVRSPPRLEQVPHFF